MSKIKKNRRGQEEIVGFAVIMIIVAIILVIVLGFSLRKGSSSKTTFQISYQAESFTQAVLQYTSDCYNGIEYLPIQKLIFECSNENSCEDARDTCDVLEEDLKQISEKSWQVSEETPVKGYKIRVISEESEILLIEQGNKTSNYKSAMQTFSRQGTDYDVSFSVYY